MTIAPEDQMLLNALADQELDAAASLALEKRLAAEPALAAEYDSISAVKQAVARLERPAVSSAFYERMAALAAPAAASRPTASSVSKWRQPDWRAMAASIVLTACLASGVTYLVTAQRADVSIEDAVASGHRRSLLAASPFDVASSDRHTVKPWLDAKLGLSPPTPDLKASGFDLVGGRVDVVAGRAVPTLVYRHREHLITLVAIPAGAEEHAAPVSTATDGYNMVRWTQGGFRYWAVSDMDAGELAVFAEDIRTH